MSGEHTDAASEALLAVETQVRQQIAADLATAQTDFAAVLAAAVHDNGGTGSGAQVTSDEDVHQALTTVLTTAQAKVQNTTSAGYFAAAGLAAASVAAEMEPLGHAVPASLPSQTPYLVALLADVALAFGAALLAAHTAIIAAHDAIAVGHATTVAARVLATNAAWARVVTSLRVRVTASAVVGVHRGFTDTQDALYRDYMAINPYVTVHKRWTVMSANPCPACKALDGVSIPVDAQFDPAATLDPKRLPPPVYRDLLGPPRHPNCRCRIALNTPTTRR